jgi:WXG100 family type VII secretion target
MGRIRVDHSRFEQVAGKIDEYVRKHKSEMAAANSEVQGVYSSWQGEDAAKFQLQWEGVAAGDSVSQKMLNSLENYAEFLRFAATQYREAQANAVNRANGLPR